MRRLSIVLLASLILGACAPTVPQEEYDSAQERIEDLEAQVTELRGELSDSQNQVATLETEVSELKDELSELRSEKDDLQSQVTELRDERNEAFADVTSLERKVSLYECDRELNDMQYGDILDSSTILSAYVARQSFSQRVQGTFRDSIWNNADSKIHGIRYIGAADNQPYVTYFMVYFDEFEWDTGVFWIDGQCWLER